VSQILNLFAAAGYRNYAKCGRLYLQMMMDLPDKYPWLFERFSSGRSHSIRHSDRHWAALSTDLIIEQVMMKSVKARSGLTHGRGISESVRNMWVCSMNKCAAVRSALFSLVNLDSSSEETEHVDTGKARLQHDQTDLSRLLTFFRNNNPFHVGEGQLHSIHTGITASTQDGINCDEAEEVGRLAMVKMDKLDFMSATLKKSDRAKTLSQVTNVAVADRNLKVDSALLFSRLLIIAQRRDDVESLFSHELTAMPAVFFKDGMLRKTAKSLLGQELKSSANSFVCNPPVNAQYVVDGGWLLHKVKWLPDGTYGSVVTQYARYVSKNFGPSAIIVFDEYCNGPTTKDHEHERRAVKVAPYIAL